MEHKEFKRDKEDKEHKKIQVFLIMEKNGRKSHKYTWTKNTELFLEELSRSHNNK